MVSADLSAVVQVARTVAEPELPRPTREKIRRRLRVDLDLRLQFQAEQSPPGERPALALASRMLEPGLAERSADLSESASELPPKRSPRLLAESRCQWGLARIPVFDRL